MTGSNSGRFDYVVVGGGLAGLWFALQAAANGASVCVACKGQLRQTATREARGGIAAAVGAGDHPDQHLRDTLDAGAGLCDPDVVRLVIDEGPAAIAQLEGIGVAFSRTPLGDLSLGLEGGHSARRIVRVGDTTGRSIQCALSRAVESHGAITVLERHFAMDLMTSGDHCRGVRLLSPTNECLDLRAPVTALASGGLGRVYRTTSNPAGATGDGIAMAWRAGATIRNLEFIQFHPTCLELPGGDVTLLTEALRGEGGVLRTATGESLMDGVHPLGSLAPRDVVARAVHDERVRGGEVTLDMTAVDEQVLVERFPAVHRLCQEHGLDFRLDPLPVRPAAHYSCGGVRVGHHGETDLTGLYAIGEVACTGLHGANRLASNSLLEAVVFAGRAARHADRSRDASFPGGEGGAFLPSADTQCGGSHEGLLGYAEQSVPLLMDQLVGVVRDAAGLDLAIDQLRHLRDALRDHRGDAQSGAAIRRPIAVDRLVTVARLVAESARQRDESRGVHWRGDHPQPDPRTRPTDLAMAEAPTPTTNRTHNRRDLQWA